MRISAEDIDLIKLMDWAQTRDDIAPFIMHIANERRCSIQQGRILKRKGVRAGVADVFLAIPKNGFHGLWIELKVGKGKLSDNQEKFLASMTAQNYMAVCVWGFDAAKAAILAYLDESVFS